MAYIQITLTRPSADVDWYNPSREEITELHELYDNNISTLTDYAADGLSCVNRREGRSAIIQQLKDDLNDPTSLIYKRKQYWIDNNIAFNIVHVP